MATLALDTIRHLLESDKTPASIRLKAAQSILAAVKHLAIPAEVSQPDDLERHMRNIMEDSAMQVALPELKAEVAAVPTATPAPLDPVRHNSTLSPAPRYRSVLPPLQRLGAPLDPSDPAIAPERKAA